MKKMVMACMCDLCGKEVNEKETRYVVKFGSGSWTNDIVQFANEKELCRDCYGTIVELMKPKSETKKSDKVVKRRGGNVKHDAAEIERLYRKGYSARRIMNELGITSAGTVNYHIKKFKDAGIICGEDNLPDFKESNGFKTVVDGSGFVIDVN